MTEPFGCGDEQFIALRPEFVLKIDGAQPILYPLDHRGITIMFLSPWEGLALALLDGTRTHGRNQALYRGVFPASADEGSLVDFDNVLASLDQRVRGAPSTSSLGVEGLYTVSDHPIEEAVRYDPRDFIVDPADITRRRADPRTRGRLETPLAIATVFTHHCFTNCLYCYAERPRVAEMPLERWRDILDEMVEMGIMIALPDNGDTLARADGLRFLEMLLERDFYFFLSTKAPFSMDDVRRLVDAGIGRSVRGRERQIQLSYDAVDEKISAKLLGLARPRVEQNTQTFLNFRKLGLTPRIKAVVTGLNVDQMLPLVEHFYPLGARQFSFVRYARTFHRHQDDLFLRPRHGEIIRRQLETLAERYPDINLDEDLAYGAVSSPQELTQAERQRLWDRRSGCGGGWSTLGVAANGDVFLCEQMTLRDPYIVGDAKVQSLREIWDSDRLRSFIFPEREQFADTVCATCPNFETCMWEQGRCYRDAFYSYGSIFQPPPLCPRNDRPGLVMG
jgi:radical SAM protein with 4Fe4S-binding SPASM domain